MLTQDLRNGYDTLFANCTVLPGRAGNVAQFIGTLMNGAAMYQNVAAATGVPWYVIGLIHGLESNFNFSTHLHNGDPLSARTVHVPRGRPPSGSPPFTWQESAADALDFDHLSGWPDWSVAGICYKLEGFNGFGYRSHGVNSPYLWSFSNNYTRGKYTSDGKWNPNAVSLQVGAITALKSMIDGQLVALPAQPAQQ